MLKFKNLVLALLLTTTFAHAGTRTIDADLINSSDHTKTWTPPAATDTLTGRASTDTFTNKSIDGGTNTITGLTNSAIANGAAIAYAKLALTGSIVNADVAVGAAIVYSKLSLTNSIVSGDLTALSVTAAKMAVSSVNLASSTVTGVLPYANGGSNASTAWTQGSVLFAGASSFAEDNSNFFWDAMNHDLLLNATTQAGAATLVVKGKNSTTGGLAIVPSSGSEYWTLSANGNVLYLINPNSNRGIFNVVNTGQIAFGLGNANGAANLDNFLIKNANSVGATSTTFSVGKSTSQTGDLTDWYDTNGTTKLAKVDVTGKIFGANINDAAISTAGLCRFDSSGNISSSSELSSDVTTSGSNVTTVAKIQGTTVSGTTGSTNVVFSTSPTLSNPVVGTQSFGDNSTKGASTAFVQTALAQLNPAAAVSAASTVNIAGTYTNAVGGVCIGDTFTVTATGALTIDGQTPAAGKRILLKNQTSGFQNGVWDVTLAGSVGVSPILTRSLDWDTSADMNAGNLIPVITGTANASTVWFQSAAVTTCSSDSEVFTQFSGSSTPADPILVLTKTASYPVLTSDFSTITKRLILECNSSAVMTVTLPALSTASGYHIFVKNIGTAECDVAPAGSDKIDGDTILQLMPGGIPQSGSQLFGGSQWDIAS